jgi:hypothetical protein
MEQLGTILPIFQLRPTPVRNGFRGAGGSSGARRAGRVGHREHGEHRGSQDRKTGTAAQEPGLGSATVCGLLVSHGAVLPVGMSEGLRAECKRGKSRGRKTKPRSPMTEAERRLATIPRRKDDRTTASIPIPRPDFHRKMGRHAAVAAVTGCIPVQKMHNAAWRAGANALSSGLERLRVPPQAAEHEHERVRFCSRPSALNSRLSQGTRRCGKCPHTPEAEKLRSCRPRAPGAAGREEGGCSQSSLLPDYDYQYRRKRLSASMSEPLLPSTLGCLLEVNRQ